MTRIGPRLVTDADVLTMPPRRTQKPGGAPVILIRDNRLTPGDLGITRARARPGGRKRLKAATRMTPREKEVTALIAEGLGNKEIAARLDIAALTVKSHVHNILEKLALRTRLEIAAYAHAAGRQYG